MKINLPKGKTFLASFPWDLALTKTILETWRQNIFHGGRCCALPPQKKVMAVASHENGIFVKSNLWEHFHSSCKSRIIFMINFPSFFLWRSKMCCLSLSRTPVSTGYHVHLYTNGTVCDLTDIPCETKVRFVWTHCPNQFDQGDLFLQICCNNSKPDALQKPAVPSRKTQPLHPLQRVAYWNRINCHCGRWLAAKRSADLHHSWSGWTSWFHSLCHLTSLQ